MSKYFILPDETNSVTDNYLEGLGYLSDNEMDQYKKLFKDILKMDSEKNNRLLIGEVQSGKTKNMIGIMLEAVMTDFDIVLFLGGTNNLLLNQNTQRLKKELKGTDVEVHGAAFATNALHKAFNRNKKTIISILKASDALNKIFDAIHTHDLRDKKIIIIDDECDNASIKINNKGIHAKISRLIERAYEILYIGVTATPYGNLISPETTSTYPDEIYFTPSSEQYTGIDYFEECDNYYMTDTDNGKALNQAMKHFFLDSAIGIIFKGIKKHEMLINNSSFTDNHTTIEDILSGNLIKYLRERKATTNYDDLFKDLFLTEYKDFSDNKIEIYEKIQELVDYIVDNESVYIFNGDFEDKETFKSGTDLACIIIGGVLISRGFTFENLTTQLIKNNPKEKVSADTLLQRCRWFGYRKSRQSILKVFMTPQIRSALKEAAELQKTLSEIPYAHKPNTDDMKEMFKIKYNYIEVFGRKINENKSKGSK